jgi:copper(I)-binding protein
MAVWRSERTRMIRLQAMLGAMLLAVAAMPATAVRAESPVTVSDAWSHPASGTVMVYASIANSGDMPDRLLGATSPSATGFALYDPAKGTAAVPAIVIPAHGLVSLSPSGPYLAMTGLKSDLADGGLFFARLHFERAGWIVAIVHVRTV